MIARATSPVADRFHDLINAMVLGRRRTTTTILAPPWTCWPIELPAISAPMTMTPTRLRECLALPGWSLRELARRLGIDDGSARQMARAKRPIPDNLAAWLEMVHAAWTPLPLDLREGAIRMGCDRGKYVRHPVNFRPLTCAEAVQLEGLASFHRRHPRPNDWEEGPLAAIDS